MKFQCQLCGYLDSKAPRVCPRCSLKAGADPDQHPEIVEAWKRASAPKLPLAQAVARTFAISVVASAFSDVDASAARAWRDVQMNLSAAKVRSECLHWARFFGVPLAEAERFVDEYTKVAMEPVYAPIDPTKQING